MNFIIATKEEYAQVGHTITTERIFNIDTQDESGNSIEKEVALRHTELSIEWEVDMVRLNPYNLVKEEELIFIIPDEEVI